jgi:hypothetical protein
MEDSIYDPNDENELSKEKHKGGRFCFIAAIIDEDDSIPVDERTYDQQAHMMVSTLDYFRGGKQTKDYHGMFDGAYFVCWFQDLLYCLEEMGVKNAVIAMDNAKYHKCLPPGTPKASWTKGRMREGLTELHIPWDLDELKPTLQFKLTQYGKANVEPEVVTMAKNAGHEVMFSQPNLSYLSPIETCWANIKGDIGLEYTDNTTMKDVEERLLRAFNKVTTTQVAGVFKKTNGHVYELLTQILDEEDADGDVSSVDDDTESEGEDSDNDGMEDNNHDELIVEGVVYDPDMDDGDDDDGGGVGENGTD